MILLSVTVLLTLGLLVSCARNSANFYPLDSAYTRFDDLEQVLGKSLLAGPDLTELRIIGFSGTEQLPIHALRIGRKDAPLKVLVIGQHHGDEVLGIEVALGIAAQLRDPKNKQFPEILKQFQIWIIPTLNPEGWQAVSNGSYQWKRKNNRDTNGNGKLDLREDGVDLNRNYPVFWETDQLTAVSNPYYKGVSAGSEAEIKTIMEFAKAQRFELALFYHSSASGAFSEKLYLPWYDKKDKQMSARYEKVDELARFYASHVKKDYSKGHYEVQSGISSQMGNARNYFFHVLSTPAFLIEIGGINQSGISVIHPEAEMMRQIRDRQVSAFNALLIKLLD